MKKRLLNAWYIKQTLAVLLAIAVVFAYTPAASAADDDTINFSDANLKQALLEAGADTGGDGEISQGELAAVTGSLSCASSGIKSLGGIEFATGITDIDISDNNISDISPLLALSGLTAANVSNNYLDIFGGSDDMAHIDTLIAGGCDIVHTPQEESLVETPATDEETHSLCVGDSFTLSAEITPDNQENTSYIWATNDPAVATVADGVVTAVSPGTTKIIAATDGGGLASTYDVDVISAKISSSVYSTTDNALRFVAVNTAPAQVLGNLNNDIEQLSLHSSNGTEYTGDTVGTGMTVRLTVNGALRDEDTVIVLGDVDGDGTVSITDYTLIRLAILDLRDLRGSMLAAGDIDGNGVITISDYTQTRLNILGLKPIISSKPDIIPEPPEDPEPTPEIIGPDSWYTIDNTQFGISSAGEFARATTDGINSALVWAKEQGYEQVNFAEGTYLIQCTWDNRYIAPTDGILVPSGLTLDLGNSTFIMEDNSYSSYCIIGIVSQSDVTILGGTLIGDLDNHEYAPDPGSNTHEYGFGICVSASVNVLIEGVTIKKMTGDGVILEGSYDYISNGGSVSSDVTVKNCDISNCRRQGISVVGAVDSEIVGNTIYDISGTDPQYGIDVEPELDFPSDGIKIHGNTIWGCSGGAITACKGSDYEIFNNTVTGNNIIAVFSTNVSIYANTVNDTFIRVMTGTTNVTVFDNILDADSWVFFG